MDDAQTTSTAMDQIAHDLDVTSPSLGLGVNPTTMTMPTPDPIPGPAPAATATAPVAETVDTQIPVSLPTLQIDSPVDTNGLLDIKNDAISHLSPLVDKLHQTPEDRFKTIMMMIQATDDQSLVKKAYTSASEIADETQRAEALLSIINEINYFTQKPGEGQEAPTT